MAEKFLDLIKEFAVSANKDLEDKKKKEKEARRQKAGENSGATMKVLNMLEKESSKRLQEEKKRKEAELEVQRLRQELKLKKQEEENAKSALFTMSRLVDAKGEQNDDKKGKKQNDQPSTKPKKQGNKKGQAPNKGSENASYAEKKTNFDGNLNKPDRTGTNKCQNKKLGDHNNSPMKQNNLNPLKNADPASLNLNPNYQQGNNVHPGSNIPPLYNPSAPFNQQQQFGPLPQFNQPTQFNPPPQFIAPPVYNQPPHFNQPVQFNPPPQFNQPQFNQMYSYPNMPNNMNQQRPNMGYNVPPQEFNQFPNHNPGFRNFRGRGGFNRGRGNFQGQMRDGANFKKSEKNKSNTQKIETEEKDGFVVITQTDKPNNEDKINNDAAEQENNNLQNAEKTIKKKKKRSKGKKKNEGTENADEKETEKDDNYESMMQNAMESFNKALENSGVQPPIPEIPAPEVVENPTSDNADAAGNIDQEPAATDTNTNQQTGAIKKEITGKAQKKEKKQAEVKPQVKDNEETNQLTLLLGLGFPSEEDALARGINLDEPIGDLIMIAKCDGNTVTEQPRTLRDMTNFKKKYPNARAIVVKE